MFKLTSELSLPVRQGELQRKLGPVRQKTAYKSLMKQIRFLSISKST